MYFVDSINRTVHLAFHGLFERFFEVFFSNSVFNRTVRLIESTEYLNLDSLDKIEAFISNIKIKVE